MSDALTYRAGTKADVPFITSTWLRGYRDSFFAKGVPNTVYYHAHHKVLDQLLPRSTVVVACMRDKPDVIVGYCAYERLDNVLVLHYMHFKGQFRKMGLGKGLLNYIRDAERPAAIMMTHRTRDIFSIQNKHPEMKQWVYNPYLLFDTLPERWSE